ncbi:MAG: hypothetical protein VZR54_02085 [Ruminococcus sp.]|nr:hypothetical protein [Ruminococcus sp.]
MNDIFIEQLVKNKRSAKDRVVFILVIIMVLAVPTALVLLATHHMVYAYSIYIALFLLFFGIWLIWFVRSHQNTEFEYQMVQDTLVISKIIAKRKRKELMRIDVRTFDELEKASEIDLKSHHFQKVLVACGDENDKEHNYYACYHHAARGLCGILFCPNEKVLNSMKPYLKKDIVLKLFYNRSK